MTSILEFLKNYKTTFLVLMAMLLGASVGLIMGEEASIFLPLGNIFINMTFVTVTPLIFFTVSSSVANILTFDSVKRTLVWSVLVYLFSALVAAIFMLLIVKTFSFGDGFNIVLKAIDAPKKISIMNRIDDIFTSSDFATILSGNAILPLMIFALFFGLAVRTLGAKAAGVRESLTNYSAVMLKMVDYLMFYAPIGVFAYFAAFFGTPLTGEYAIALTRVSVIFWISSIAFGVILYSLLAYYSNGLDGIMSLRYLVLPAATAFATKSSLATLPLNLDAANRMNIPGSVANISITMGSVIHMTGSAMGAVLKLAFLYYMFDVPMGGMAFYMGSIIISIVVCFLAVGIPGGGMLLEITLISMFGFPIGALPVLLLLNFMIDPIITVLNAVGDVVSSMAVAKIVKGRDWVLMKEIEDNPILEIREGDFGE